MRIQASTVAMDSRHVRHVEQQHSERLEVWVDPPAARAPSPTPTVSMPAEASPSEVAPTEAASEALSFEPSPLDKLKIAIIERLLESLSGKAIKIQVPEDLKDPKDAPALNKNIEALVSHAQGQRDVERPRPEAAPRHGWGMRYESNTRYHEQESSSFTAQGVVKTQDGKEIAFTVDLRMQREYLREESVRIQAGDAPLKDPLVINFEGPAAALTQTKFSFDLDADGEDDQISFLMPGSGFLVLDADEDGTISDGQEVFGALSGDAYADLAAYDEDGNHWLDEGDAIFSRLRIWTKDANGKDQLFALGEKGIGALYLGAIASPFALKDSENTLLGQVRRSGVFLFEDGRAGTMQQIDLAV
ncbi:hypothetical protein D3C87_485430 [compost metagenome]